VTPSIQTDNDDDFFDVKTPESPQQTLHDMISTSTVAAGPSVQLVERMSAAVRRLESEKVGMREEVARLVAQRDEARGEVGRLVAQVNEGQEMGERVKALEAELATVKGRYETTLEMLGEKSEEVEELKADVDDVKAMYRELVDRVSK
jgi:chromosome segregation ATPase